VDPKDESRADISSARSQTSEEVEEQSTLSKVEDHISDLVIQQLKNKFACKSERLKGRFLMMTNRLLSF
jgi:hypothetical protein